VHAMNAGQSATQIMMGLGSALTSGAAMFQDKDNGQVSVQTPGRHRIAQHSRRRKIA